jgi:hypothetical protein
VSIWGNGANAYAAQQAVWKFPTAFAHNPGPYAKNLSSRPYTMGYKPTGQGVLPDIVRMQNANNLTWGGVGSPMWWMQQMSMGMKAW